jgi:acid phosphatase family membrane protein YuiD
MLDFDLAEMYGTATKVLKQSVKRNMKRFPSDFMFELTKNEWNELVTNCDHIPKSMKYNYVPSFAFTEQGIAMLSGLLNSDIAINTNIVVMRAFVMLRQYALNYAELNQKIEKFIQETNVRFENNDVKTNEIFKLLKELLEHKRELEKPSNPIGFRTSANS